ncbi:VWA domain-containing protein [Bifidobacterium pseudocatenulatum]|nr:VWA domain-containing protein [Bifidobacterium pseudocatenulatum]
MLMRHAHEYEAKPRGGLAKRIVAVFASVAMLGGMGYATTSAALAEDDQTSSGDTSTLQPANSKSIAKIGDGDGDQYALHLTASGDSSSSTVTAAVPADIVLVLDKSGSMEGSRDTNAKNAATALAQKLLTGANNALSPNQQVQMAVVTFSKEAQTTSNFTTSSDAISGAVSAAPDGGTNWEDALRTANSLSSGRAGVQKYIVFLSDGNPTFRSTSYSGCFAWGKEHPEYKTQAACEANNEWWELFPSYQWKTDPDGSDGNIHGNGRDDGYGYNYAAALAAANERGNAALYVVKVSKDANKMSDLAKGAHAVTGKEYDGTSAKNLTNAFEQIYNTITTTAKIRAYSITDALSQWVDPVDFANAVDGTDITKYVTATNNGAAISGYTALYHVDGNGNRTITVTFNNDDGMIVGKNETIDVSFKVKPNDAAYADYATKQQYPNTGEAATGDESAGKQGYFSNAEAHLNYCVVTSVNDQESECTKQQTLNYAKPVVQVKLGQITINKTWSDDVNKHADDTVKVQLQRTKTGEATAQTENVASIKLNTSNNWTATVGNLQPGYIYSVAEIPEDSRYAVSYQYGNAAADATGVALTKAMVWQSDGNGGNMTATLTNTLKTTTLSNAITVRKNLEGRNWKADDSFDFELTADGNAPLPSDCAQQAQPSCKVTVAYDADSPDSQHSATFGDITYNAGKADYTYTITESNGNIAALHYSGAKYQIVVTVDEKDGIWTASVKSVTKLADDNGKNVSEPQETGGPIAFTNTYVAVSALPLTGGTTDRQWLLVGGSIGGLAILLVGAAGIWNSKKRLV